MSNVRHAAELGERCVQRRAREIGSVDDSIGKVAVWASLFVERVLVGASRGAMCVAIDVEPADGTNSGHVDVEGLGADDFVVADGEHQLDSRCVVDLDPLRDEHRCERRPSYETNVRVDHLSWKVSQRFERRAVHSQVVSNANIPHAAGPPTRPVFVL